MGALNVASNAVRVATGAMLGVLLALLIVAVVPATAAETRYAATKWVAINDRITSPQRTLVGGRGALGKAGPGGGWYRGYIATVNSGRETVAQASFEADGSGSITHPRSTYSYSQCWWDTNSGDPSSTRALSCWYTTP